MNRRDFFKAAAVVPLAAAPLTAAPDAVASGGSPLTLARLRAIQFPGHHKLLCDYNYLPGDTIKEKYESLTTVVWVAIHSLMASLQEASEALPEPIPHRLIWETRPWALSSPELSSIFETAANGFEPAEWPDPIPAGWENGIIPCGRIKNCRSEDVSWQEFDLYKYALLTPKDCSIYLGYEVPGFEPQYGRVEVRSFVI